MATGMNSPLPISSHTVGSFTVNDRPVFVLDIGATTTRCGLAGEGAPREVLQSNFVTSHGKQLYFYPALGQTVANQEEWESALTIHLTKLFFKKLIYHPAERKVVIVRAPFGLDAFYRALEKILTTRFKVAEVEFVSSAVAAVIACGRRSALIVDVGTTYTTVTPVFAGKLIPAAVKCVTLGAETVCEAMRRQIMDACRVTHPMSGADSEPAAITFRKTGSLTDDIVYGVIERCGLVAPSRHLRTPEMAKASTFPLHAADELVIPPSVRMAAVDALFEGNEDGQSIQGIVADSLIACEVEVRAKVAECIVLVGGLCKMKNFHTRLHHELRSIILSPASDGIHKTPRIVASKASNSLPTEAPYHPYDSLKPLIAKINYAQPMFDADLLPWTGAAVYGLNTDYRQQQKEVSVGGSLSQRRESVQEM